MARYDVKISTKESGGDDPTERSDGAGDRADPPPSVNLDLDDVPAQLEIRDSEGKVRIHELPSSVEAPPWTEPAPRDETRAGSSVLRDAARSIASWVLLLALSIDVLAFFLEPLYVLREGASFRAGLATAFAAIGLSAFFALATAVPVAAVHGAVRLLARLPRPWGYAWPAPLAALGWTVVATVAPHRVSHALSVSAGHSILVALLTASLLVAAGITKLRAGPRVVLACVLSAAELAVIPRLPAVLTSEPRDLLWLCAVFTFAAGFYPLRRRAADLPHERVSRSVGVLFAGSLLSLSLPAFVASGWRAHDGGQFAPRLARFCRMLIDFDGDGFSPVAWGTDCDDSDAARNPAVPERLDGVDHNCNGRTRPAASTPGQRGLAPSAGEPDAAPGEIDRVVLVTIDCLREDAFTPQVMPNLTKLATRGVRFEKLYSNGARTTISLPFILRGSVDAPAVAQLLGSQKVSTTALFGYRHASLEGNVFAGFGAVTRPDMADHRIRAAELTDRALADLLDPASAHAHFLWVHYFDAHGPRARRVLPPDVPSFPPIAGETDGESALYLSELFFVDRNLGRLFDAIAQKDDFRKTLVIVTSDHGEGFGRHGVFEHGVSAFEAIVHVPGVMVAPGLAPGRYPHVAAQRDIAATVLGAFGLVALHPEIETFGRSWLRLRQAPTEPLHAFVVSYETTIPFELWSDAPMASLVDDRAKLSVSYVDRITRFYRLDVDPGEDHETALDSPAEVGQYREELELFRDLDRPPP